MTPEEEKKEPEHPGLDWKQGVLIYLHDLVYLIVTIMLVFLVVFRIIVVSGDSMKMTLLDGDYLLLLSNTFYHEPEYGDIVVISKESFDDGNAIVKRVIATEGQTVDIDFEHGIVFVDGVALEEDYINNLTTNPEGMTFPLVVEEGCVFVLGDNRQVSRDSRSPDIGLVDRREILGKAIILLFPGNSRGFERQDFSRIGAIK